MTSTSRIIQELTKRSVAIHHPASVDIASTVNTDRIAPGVIIHSGCRISGKDTSIGPGCVIGEEAPVTLDNCQLASNVTLKGGFFSGAVFLSGVSLGSCAHVRPGTLLEEQAVGGHSVGLKQTVLMPFVTMGSLINFCDCLMAGGTGRRNHSEVGSSYVHFNFTPHQDKATASLLGDVPRGVMLDQLPIFLGGQGGLVGPLRIEYGTVVAAGTICRRDITKPGRLVFGETGRTVHDYPYVMGAYGDIARIVANNLTYLGNLHALLQWYHEVRSAFMRIDPFETACCKGAERAIRLMIHERVARMTELAEKMPRSLEIAQKRATERPYRLQKDLIKKWPGLADKIETDSFVGIRGKERDRFLHALDARDRNASYLTTMKAIPAFAKANGSAWLQSVVDSVTGLW